MKAFLPLLLLAAAACSDGTFSAESAPAGSAAEAPRVAFAGRVTDAASILEPQEEARLSARLAELERTSRHQLVVVTVPSLGGEDIAAFTRDLGNAWGIGRAEEDDGVLLLVAPNERMARIAVGLGLEKALPDPLCSRIMEEHILPRLREGDMAGGIEAGVAALAEHLRRV